MANPSKPSGEHTRVVLEGIEKVSYGPIDGRYYFTPFAACLRACLAFLGESYTYEYIMGMSGAAFRLMWNSTMWDGGNVDIVFMAEDMMAPFRRAFEAVGYACEALEHGQADEDAFRERIVESIGVRGRPILAFGVIGPPEICIVSGYDEGGDVLVGWNFFQDRPGEFPEAEFEPPGYFRKRDWFENTPGLIAIGEKRDVPPLRDLHCKALAWALKVVHRPMVREFYGGLAAYKAWAEAMQRDEDFVDDIETLQQRKMVHYDAMCMVAERGGAARFLRQIAEHEPAMAEELGAAADCYDQEMAFLGHMHEATGGFISSDEQLRRLVDPAVRRQIAEAILQARDKDAEAAGHISAVTPLFSE
jgi:hypothetical protein